MVKKCAFPIVFINLYLICHTSEQFFNDSVCNYLVFDLLMFWCSGFNWNLLKVRVGEWDTQSSESDEELNSHQDFGISQIIIHPNHHNGTMFNDVALIQLSSAIESQKHINTICIPQDKQVNYDSRSCISTGWGKNGFGK